MVRSAPARSTSGSRSASESPDELPPTSPWSPPSEVGSEIAEFLDEASGHVGGLEEIREFFTTARNEAGGEDVVCRPEVIGETLELAIYSESGRFLDSLTLPAARLPARAEEMPRLIQSFVRIVKDAPGR